MALDSKLRGCDLVKLKVSDVTYGHSVSGSGTVLQQKTGSPVQFELTKGTREASAAWIKMVHLRSSDYLFQSRIGSSRHISTYRLRSPFLPAAQVASPSLPMLRFLPSQTQHKPPAPLYSTSLNEAKSD